MKYLFIIIFLSFNTYVDAFIDCDDLFRYIQSRRESFLTKKVRLCTKSEDLSIDIPTGEQGAEASSKVRSSLVYLIDNISEFNMDFLTFSANLSSYYSSFDDDRPNKVRNKLKFECIKTLDKKEHLHTVINMLSDTKKLESTPLDLPVSSLGLFHTSRGKRECLNS